jgi:hypothetical protein
MRFEKTSSKELVNKRFQLGDGAITITRADDLGVPYPERTVWFWRDKPDPPDSGAGVVGLRRENTNAFASFAGVRPQDSHGPGVEIEHRP